MKRQHVRRRQQESSFINDFRNGMKSKWVARVAIVLYLAIVIPGILLVLYAFWP